MDISGSKLKLFEAHPFRHFHIGKLLLIVKWWWSFLYHRFMGHVTIDTSFTLTLCWALNSVGETWTILFIALGFFACAKFAIRLDILYCHALHLFDSLGSFLGIQFVFAILTFTHGSTDPIILETLAIGFETLISFTGAELSSICK